MTSSSSSVERTPERCTLSSWSYTKRTPATCWTVILRLEAELKTQSLKGDLVLLRREKDGLEQKWTQLW